MGTTTRTVDVSGIDSIELRWFGDVIVEQGTEEGLVVEGDEELLDELNARVVAGTLVLELRQDWLQRVIGSLKFFARGPLTYRVKVKELTRVSISGNGSFRAVALRADSLKIGVSGRGQVDVSDLHVSELDVRTSGRATINLAGNADTQTVSVSGSANLGFERLQGLRADVRISGHAEADINVSDALSVTISGLGTLRYRGDPKVDQSISGAGTVKHVEG